jgi:hypothetical protein
MSMSELYGRELRSVLCGTKIGEGTARTVYVCRLNDGYVVKVERGARSFQNIVEWDTWAWVMSRPRHARWFAQCQNISPTGMVLIQRRALPVREKELPKKLPHFLCDLKPENFGLVDGKVVCFDYGTVSSVIADLNPGRLVKAEWRK